jgi:tRNA 2-thiouridine synthesizing protein A
MSDIKTVDASGLSCPEPVILARRAIQQGQFPIRVLVDTGTSRDNVSRMAQSAGCKVGVEDKDRGFVLTLTK